MRTEKENHVIIIETILFVFICFVILVMGRLSWAFMLLLIAKKHEKKRILKVIVRGIASVHKTVHETMCANQPFKRGLTTVNRFFYFKNTSLVYSYIIHKMILHYYDIHNVE